MEPVAGSQSSGMNYRSYMIFQKQALAAPLCPVWSLFSPLGPEEQNHQVMVTRLSRVQNKLRFHCCQITGNFFNAGKFGSAGESFPPTVLGCVIVSLPVKSGFHGSKPLPSKSTLNPHFQGDQDDPAFWQLSCAHLCLKPQKEKHSIQFLI